MLTPRWMNLDHHDVQMQYWGSPHRFNVVPAGRRSGKTERAKRKLVLKAFEGSPYHRPSFFAGAPTRDQAKRIFWDDLKRLVPKRCMDGTPSETELIIRLMNGAEICVIGMDKPERIEGSPRDGGILDEFANMKPQAWGENVRPALSDRLGWCDLIGVPEGRNHYYELYSHAEAEMMSKGVNSEWGAYTWFSSDILPASEIESARRSLDELTFQQEYEASFVNFQGLCYYAFDRRIHCASLPYIPTDPLIIMLDFNVSPGVAGIGQVQALPNGQMGVAIIGEVWIPRNSNTVHVCNRIIQDWGNHQGLVYVYGDATGGASGTAKVAGSDWSLVEKTLRPKFGDRLYIQVEKTNPRERVRVNCVNSILQNTEGQVRMMVDPEKAIHVVKDFEGVTLLEGGSGEIDKRKTPQLTHISDGIGYYIAKEFPIDGRGMEVDTY